MKRALIEEGSTYYRHDGARRRFRAVKKLLSTPGYEDVTYEADGLEHTCSLPVFQAWAQGRVGEEDVYGDVVLEAWEWLVGKGEF